MLFHPDYCISSREPKAIETAQLIAKELFIPTSSADGLQEHDRSNVPHLRSGEFISMIELFFRKPNELVLGKETATEALKRFDSSLQTVLKSHPDKTLAVVTHGTVLALFLARQAQRSGFQLWRDLGLPSFAVLSRPDLKVEQITPRID